MAKDELKKLHLEHYSHPDEFGKWLGYRLIEVNRTAQSAKVGLTIRQDHLSPSGRVHGGVISALFDFACGAAVFSTLEPKDYCSTVELKVNYLKALLVGDELRGETQVIFRGKRLCVIHGFLYRLGEKNPVAMATATFNIVTQGHGK